MWFQDDPSRIDLDQAIHTLSFENPTGAAAAAGASHGGRKGAPMKIVEPGERILLGDVEGPGTVRHLWMTFPPMPPEAMRALVLEVTWDDAPGPSLSVPCLDFFGLPHGRPTRLSSALVAAQEARGFNSWIPMPFHRRARFEITNHSSRRFPLYYQIAFTRGPVAPEAGLLHATFRRENPTALGQDFVISEGFAGPGRFLGCNVGIRILHEEGFSWYGEGEVKMFLDGDEELPTWCGTGLEDYVGTAWGMGAHQVPLQGVPHDLHDPEAGRPMPDLVSFYRWHLPDPIVFRERIRVTLQQIGAVPVPRGQGALREWIERESRLAGSGWMELGEKSPLEAFGICERRDDVCATAYLYSREPQPVPALDLSSALADIERRPWETASPAEAALGVINDT
ncbi:MAG: hypothetical protein CL910_13055 [Deltaproteobacteria bacterium]|jgi:hypothetical protein|nr:hypothetical protein [Deltaproteobacteria bacterium]